MEGGRVDRLLCAVAADQDAQQQIQLPLVLLVASRGAAGEHRVAVGEDEGRAERGARAAAWFEAGGRFLVQPRHLQTGAEAEAEPWDGR